MSTSVTPGEWRPYPGSDTLCRYLPESRVWEYKYPNGSIVRGPAGQSGPASQLPPPATERRPIAAPASVDSDAVDSGEEEDSTSDDGSTARDQGRKPRERDRRAQGPRRHRTPTQPQQPKIKRSTQRTDNHTNIHVAIERGTGRQTVVESGPSSRLTPKDVASDGIQIYKKLISSKGGSSGSRPEYAVSSNPKQHFQIYNVIQVLYDEPDAGNTTWITPSPGGTQSTRQRKFVLVKEGQGFSVGLSISDYGRQGVNNLPSGVKKSDHRPVFTDKNNYELLPGEAEPVRSRDGIILSDDFIRDQGVKINTHHPTWKLDPFSRLNIKKYWNILHTNEIFVFGKVDPNYVHLVRPPTSQPRPPQSSAIPTTAGQPHQRNDSVQSPTSGQAELSIRARGYSESGAFTTDRLSGPQRPAAPPTDSRAQQGPSMQTGDYRYTPTTQQRPPAPGTYIPPEERPTRYDSRNQQTQSTRSSDLSSPHGSQQRPALPVVDARYPTGSQQRSVPQAIAPRVPIDRAPTAYPPDARQRPPASGSEPASSSAYQQRPPGQASDPRDTYGSQQRSTGQLTDPRVAADGQPRSASYSSDPRYPAGSQARPSASGNEPNYSSEYQQRPSTQAGDPRNTYGNQQRSGAPPIDSRMAADAQHRPAPYASDPRYTSGNQQRPSAHTTDPTPYPAGQQGVAGYPNATVAVRPGVTTQDSGQRNIAGSRQPPAMYPTEARSITGSQQRAVRSTVDSRTQQARERVNILRSNAGRLGVNLDQLERDQAGMVRLAQSDLPTQRRWLMQTLAAQNPARYRQICAGLQARRNNHDSEEEEDEDEDV